MFTLYLSDNCNIDKVLHFTDLALDELETIVGRFAKHSSRAGKLRGELVVEFDSVYIRHHFSKKVLWRKVC